MNKNNSYYNWFSKVIAIFIELFFVCAILSTLYVFTYPFNGILKIFIFIILIAFFCLIIYLFKGTVQQLINKLLIYLDKFSTKRMIVYISILLIILKIIYTASFYFDPTIDGDIFEYISITNSIVETGYFRPATISHLLGVALHLSLFKILNIPYDIGMFLVFSFATIVNFISFSKIIGKNKSFILIVLYLLMPSSILLTFCPTHEIFVYLYYSLFIFVFVKYINVNSVKKSIFLMILMILDIVLCCFVSPAGYILLIVSSLTIIITNVKITKKILLILVIMFSLLSTNLISKCLKLDDTQSNLNLYYILVRGSSVECNGEHIDGYTEELFDQYIEKFNVEDTWENKEIAMKYYLKEQYIYLLTHPIDLFKLLVHKFYVEWSGDHYSIEMAYNHNSFSYITYYSFLVISALIYLFVLTLGIIYYKKSYANVIVSNIKLMLLGVVAMLLISLVLNKYSVYMTIFIYFIAFYRADFNN